MKLLKIISFIFLLCSFNSSLFAQDKNDTHIVIKSITIQVYNVKPSYTKMANFERRTISNTITQEKHLSYLPNEVKIKKTNNSTNNKKASIIIKKKENCLHLKN